MAAKLEQYLGTQLYNEFMSFVLNSSRVAKSKSKSKPEDNNYQSGLVRVLEYYEENFPESRPLKGNEVSIEWWINFLNLYNKNEKGLYDFDTPSGQHGKNGVKDYIYFLFNRKNMQSPSVLKRSAKGDFLVIQKDENGEIIGLEKAEGNEKKTQNDFTFKEFAVKVLQKAGEPLTVNDIWKKGCDWGMDKLLNSNGKTPDQTLSAVMTRSVKQKDSLFCLVSKNPNVFGLKSFNKEQEKHMRPLNQILYGPPGTGKTYNTVIYAYAICNGIEDIEKLKKDCRDEEKYKEILVEYKTLQKQGRIEFITFHQSYGYEEFIQGIKPSVDKGQVVYNVEDGIFKKFCDKAKDDEKNNYVFIIDEINRGNVSKIFGELITLIEEGKRISAEAPNQGMTVKLPYKDENGEDVVFGVPDNVYILGTMNTADRSLVQLDAALRRRFRFIEMMPNPKLLSAENKKDNQTGVELDKLLASINERICALIDREHQIGHSYFMKVKTIDDLRDTFQYEIIPLLQEYFYEDYENIDRVLKGNGFIQPKPKKFDVITFEINVEKFKCVNEKEKLATADDFIAIYDNSTRDNLKEERDKHIEVEQASANDEEPQAE